MTTVCDDVRCAQAGAQAGDRGLHRVLVVAAAGQLREQVGAGTTQPGRRASARSTAIGPGGTGRRQPSTMTAEPRTSRRCPAATEHRDRAASTSVTCLTSAPTR